MLKVIFSGASNLRGHRLWQKNLGFLVLQLFVWRLASHVCKLLLERRRPRQCAEHVIWFFQKRLLADPRQDRAPFDRITSESWPPKTAITNWKDWIRGRMSHLDFVAPDLDFVAAGLVFIAGSLDFVAAGLDFGSDPPAVALPPEFSAP